MNDCPYPRKEPKLKVFLSGALWGFVAIGVPIAVYVWRTGGLY